MTRDHIGTRTLQEVRDHYWRYLFEEYLPFCSRRGVDHERGGFHPRCVMRCLLALERMIGRGGAVSGVWG